MSAHEGYIYLLKSELDGSLYFGSTNNINRRIREHNDGASASTRHKRPWKLRAVVKLDHISHARKVEQMLKAQKKKLSLSWFLTIIAEHEASLDQ